MLSPHFVYPIEGTSWHIVISNGAQHFYFDSTTKSSVWQIADTGINDLEKRVNFDDLAVLFAKSNGIDFSPKGSQHEPSKIEDTLPESENTETFSPQATEFRLHEETEPIEPELASTTVEDPESKLDHVESTPSIGLSLGYSSSEEESSDSEQETGTAENMSDVNSGLDLGFDEENEDLDYGETDARHTEQFEAILDMYQDEISVMDPWMLVEEDLLPKFAEHAAFYDVPDQSVREKIFNDWVIKRNRQTEESPSREVFPTALLTFYRFLQEHKTDVKKLYYVEFEKIHKDELAEYQSTDFDLESSYRQLKVTLNDFSAYEKTQKKNRNIAVQDGDKNLKVLHVERYLVEQDLAKYAANSDIQRLEDGLDYFDQWMQICNLFALPERLVHNPCNFILGDEKRVAAYKKFLDVK